jgi:dUTP pyrophosphatase
MDNSEFLEIKIRLLDEATLPQYQTSGSVGLDLMSIENGFIKPFDVTLVSTGLFLELPEGVEGQIRTRSGLALKNKIIVLNSPGTIDSDYRGEIKLILMNLSKEQFKYNKGDRLAQIVFASVIKVKFKVVNEIENTMRGSGGFGHTGM